MESTDLMALEAHLARKTLVLLSRHSGRMSHPLDTPLGSDVSTLEPLICTALCLVIGKLPQPVRTPHGRLMQVTRSLEALWGVHLAAGVFDAAHMAVAMAVLLGTSSFPALSSHLSAVVIQEN